jgi:two-component sensor histidine kinase
MFKIKFTGLLILAIALCNFIYGQGNSDQGNYKTQFDALIKRAERTKGNADSLTFCINELRKQNSRYHDKASTIYINYYNAQHAWLTSDFYKSMQLAVLSLNEAQKWKINKPLPEIYSLIGTLQKENTNYPMAFVAAQKGLDIARQNNDTLEIIRLLGMKAMFKRGYSMHFNLPIDKDSSLNLRLEALKIAESNPKYERDRIPFYDNIAQHYTLVKDYKKAEYYGQKGIALALKYDQKRSLTYGYSFIGQAYYYSGDRKQGVLYLNKALLLTMQLKQPYRKMELYDDLAQCYKSSSDYKDAFFYLTKFRWLVDSLQVRVNVKQISELQIKYETAKKDEALALLNQAAIAKNRQLKWLFGGILVFILFIVVLVYLYTVIRDKNKALTTSNLRINDQSEKLQTLMKELHHRVKNNLQIVSSLLNLQSNRVTDQEALNVLNSSRQRIEAMSIIHNSLYQRDNANKVDMKEFLPVLVNNILESFGINEDEIDISMDISTDGIDVDIAMPLGLIINEWITNIYKHAYKNMDERPRMGISVSNSHGIIRLRINDNGVGMPMAVWNNPTESFGVKMIKILIKQVGGMCQVSNTGGTTLELDIPYVK